MSDGIVVTDGIVMTDNYVVTFSEGCPQACAGSVFRVIFVFKVLLTLKIHEAVSSVCVCLSIASHTSEASEAIDIKFDTVTASVK